MVMDYHMLDMEDHIKQLCEHQGPKVRLHSLPIPFFSLYLQSNDVLKWFAQLLSALAYLGNCHVAHCDLKLKNILLSKEDTLKLCDFGSAIKFPPPNMTMIYQRGTSINCVFLKHVCYIQV